MLIYLSRKVVCSVLFCSYEDPRNRDASDRVLGVFGKLSTRRGAWVFDSMTFELGVQKFLNIE
jgi:hypothetical protein